MTPSAPIQYYSFKLVNEPDRTCEAKEHEGKSFRPPAVHIDVFIIPPAAPVYLAACNRCHRKNKSFIVNKGGVRVL